MHISTHIRFGFVDSTIVSFSRKLNLKNTGKGGLSCVQYGALPMWFCINVMQAVLGGLMFIPSQIPFKLGKK